MLPKPVVPEKGSRKVLNGVEVWTIHNFTTEKGNVYETIDGSFILPNGQPILDKTILEYLPEEHKQRALEWWEKRYGQEAPPPGPKLTKAEIMAQIQSLQAQVESMEGEEQAGAEPADSEKNMKESEEVKRSPGRPKNKGIETLKQMGIGA